MGLASATRHRSGSPPGLLSRWLPVVAWALVIWVFSGDAFSGDQTRALLLPMLRAVFPNLPPDRLLDLHDLLRKLAHPTEYGALALLLFRALEDPARAATTTALTTLAACATYAALDELHQAWVPSRGGSTWDALLDSVGAACALALRAFLVRALNAGRRSPA